MLCAGTSPLVRMKFARFALALALSSVLAFASPIIPQGMEHQHAATHHIVMENVADGGSCSATAVGPHTILTAGHCFIPSHSIEIDGQKADVLGLIFDDNDHMMIIVNQTFDSYTPIVERDLVPDEQVHMWGNPGHSVDVYRVGVVERVQHDADGDTLTWLLMPGAPGDSGSGVLDAGGNLVAVISVGNSSGEMGVFSLAFTPAQLASIR